MQLRVLLKIGVFLAVLISYTSFSNACLAAGKWDQKTSGISAVGDHTAVVYNGKMYVSGGTDGTHYYNDLWEYDFTCSFI